MTVTILVFVIVFLAALCVSLFVALVRSARLASEAIKISTDCQRIAEDAQSLARSWQGVAERFEQKVNAALAVKR